MHAGILTVTISFYIIRSHTLSCAYQRHNLPPSICFENIRTHFQFCQIVYATIYDDAVASTLTAHLDTQPGPIM